MNAFNWEMAADLERALQEADADDTVRAVVLTGRGKGAPRRSAQTAQSRGSRQNERPWVARGVCTS